MKEAFAMPSPRAWSAFRFRTSCICIAAMAWIAGCAGGERAVPPGSLRPGAGIVRHLVVFESPGEYCAWPSLARTAGGDLIVVFTRTVEHLSPDGAIVLCRSTDEGRTWSAPATIYDTPIDDRESGLAVLSDGRILAFLWSTFHTPEYYGALSPGSYEGSILEGWKRHVLAPAYRSAAPLHGAWIMISTDGGRRWSPCARGKDAVHGGIQLRDGSLLVASYREERGGIGVHAAPSTDSSWRRVATITSPVPDSLGLGEPHMVQLRSGRVIMMIRATVKPYNDLDARCVLWESFSDDNGRTWVAPFPTKLWGFPPHLTLLADGRVLCTYGYRRPPFGERACVSADGVAWSLDDEVTLRGDAPNGDLGYPASLELEPGLVLSVYYQSNVRAGTVQRMHPPDPARTKPGILGTIWKVPPAASPAGSGGL